MSSTDGPKTPAAGCNASSDPSVLENAHFGTRVGAVALAGVIAASRHCANPCHFANDDEAC